MGGKTDENRVLILGGVESAEANLVSDALQTLGVKVMHCDTPAFPATVHLSVMDGTIHFGERVMPLPRTVYVRGLACHPLIPAFEEDLAKRPHGLVAQCDEKRAFLESFLLLLKRRGCGLVNGIRANALHSQKPWQLDTLARAGLPVPRWLATNDARLLRQFASEMPRVIYKPLAGGAPAQWLEPSDMEQDRLASLQLAPVLFQEYIPGVPMRVYTTGRRIAAAAEIHGSAPDYRNGYERVLPARLTAEERKLVLAAAEKCGMSFSGVDCIRSADGLVLLECNPSPLFATFQELTGRPIAGMLAELLAGVNTR